MPLSEREEQEARDTRFEGITMPSQIFSELYILISLDKSYCKLQC